MSAASALSLTTEELQPILHSVNALLITLSAATGGSSISSASGLAFDGSYNIYNAISSEEQMIYVRQLLRQYCDALQRDVVPDQQNVVSTFSQLRTVTVSRSAFARRGKHADVL